MSLEFKLHQLYRTRDGRKAQIFMLDNGGNHDSMLGAVYKQGQWAGISWQKDGKWFLRENDADLVSEWREPSLKAEKVISLHGARAGVEVLNFLHDTLDGVLTSGYIKVTVEEIADTSNA